MQQVLDAPLTQHQRVRFESVDEAVERCGDSMQHQLGPIYAALSAQQKYRERGDYDNMIKMYRVTADTLEEIGRRAHSPKTNEMLGELWERAGAQLKGTRHYAEHYHCFTSAMAHYKEANKHERFLQAFRNLYGQ